MTKEQTFFLDVLADHLNGRPTSPPDGLDWSQIMSYAASHQVQGIIWHQCHTYLSGSRECQDISKSLHSSAVASQFFYTNNKYAYQELKAVLQKKQIRFFAVKGLAVADLFPYPCFRTMGDIDIIVSEEDKPRLEEIMKGLGYQLTYQDYELICKRQLVTFEIHDYLVYKQNQERQAVKRYFDNCWDYVRVNEEGDCLLDWNFHLVFLIQHLKKHFGGNGIGFRQFMDLAVVSRGIPDLDWNIIREDLEKIGLWDFTLTAFAFCKKWFDIDPPVDIGEPNDSFYEESTELVFSNGVFGFDNEHHKEHSIERRLRVSSLPRPLSKARLVLKEVFIPYKYMIELPYCKFLIGKKYLLPFAWLYRIYYVITKKRDLLESKRKLVFNSEEELIHHHELMNKWGL